jgi:putative ABC transport system permease protein
VNPLLTIPVAVRALLRNKMRSFLTTLGIVIGVGAVIAMVAIGEGAKARVEATFAAMGTNLLIVQSGSSGMGGARGGAGSQPTLTWDDLEAIRAEVPTARWAAPQLNTRAQVMSEDQNWMTQITGTTPEFMHIRSWTIARGRSIDAADVEGRAKVAVLGQTASDMLFGPGIDPVGRSIRIRNVPFEVVGLLAVKGQSPMGQDYDDTLIIPSTTWLTAIQGGLQKFVPGVIMVSATSPADTARAEEQIAALLRQRHRILPGMEDDFRVRNLAEFAAAQQEGTRTLTLLLASIAAVSLLVGGIGIMNIMLVSVTERTREIGIRMAVGAKPRHILSQFLVEALTLSSAGGLIGVGLGLFVAERLSTRFDWPTLVRADVVVLAVGFSAAVGIVFGLYPARKAARLDPIEALRYE